jgi:hypothetical protein
MTYNRRDRIGHWVNRAQPAGNHCTHACCRNYREHPRGEPVIRANRSLRNVSDDDLAAEFARVSTGESEQEKRATAQVLHEMERRDEAAEQHRRHVEAVQAGRAARGMEREAETERLYLAAEEYTRGNWTNAKGSVRMVSDREILTGRQDVFNRYASEEAKEFFRSNPRPTAAYFRGQDTKYQGVYTERPRYGSRRRAAFAAKVWRA